jgi:hypothetical protein
MASVRKNSSSKSRSASDKRAAVPLKRARALPVAKPSPQFAICVRNDDYPASLELRKLYPVLDDEFATQHGMIRVIDESGEDYLFPDEYFVRVSLPETVEKQLRKIA